MRTITRSLNRYRDSSEAEKLEVFMYAGAGCFFGSFSEVSLSASLIGSAIGQCYIRRSSLPMGVIRPCTVSRDINVTQYLFGAAIRTVLKGLWSTSGEAEKVGQWNPKSLRRSEWKAHHTGCPMRRYQYATCINQMSHANLKSRVEESIQGLKIGSDQNVEIFS